MSTHLVLTLLVLLNHQSHPVCERYQPGQVPVPSSSLTNYPYANGYVTTALTIMPRAMSMIYIGLLAGVHDQRPVSSR